MMLDQYMKMLGQELGLNETFTTDVPGSFAFPMDDETTVLVTALPREGCYFSSVIGENPTENEGEILHELMLGNLYGRATSGAILGLDAEGKKLTISHTIDYSVDYKEFRDIFEDFLNSVDFWKQEIQSYKK